MDPSLPRQLDYLAQEIDRLEGLMIDPVEFGEIKAQVQGLQNRVDSIASDVKALLEMANKGKGGLWMFNTGLVFAGGVLAWVVEHFAGKVLK